jgi:hypothetical protein
LSWFHSDSSDRVDWTKDRFFPYLLRSFFILAALIVVFSGAYIASAQVPAPPPAASEPSQQEPQPAPPSPPQPQPPLQQYPIQQPGRPSLTPAEPPSTTIPPWTPPLPPAPSQTNIPAPFPILGPGAGQVGVPGLTIPGAFRPTLGTVRGAALEFHPTLRVAEEYTDNFFQTTSRTEENFRSILGPGFSLLLNGARTFGTLSTTVDLVHDTAPDSGDDPKVFPSLNAAIRYALTPRLGLTLTETFVRNDSASATADPSGIRRGRQTFDSNALAVAVDWLLDQVATQAYYRNLLFFNEDDDEGGNQQNRVSRGDTITHILGLNASTRIAVDYIVRAGYEFSRSDTSGGGTGTDTTTHTAFGSAARQFGLYTTAGVSSSVSYQTDESTRIYNASLFGAYGLPTGLSLSGSVGYSILQSDAEDTEGAVSANFNASYRFARAVFSVGVFQDFRQTGQQGENFGTVESRSYFGSFLYQFTPFINSIARVTYSENEPTGTGNVRRGGAQTTTLTYGASLNWQVLRWLTASLDYTYTKQTGGDVFNQSVFGGTGDYAENRFRLALFATF